MNILLSDWLPVYLKDGRRVKIAPYDLTKNLRSNPAVSLAFNRPDLDATVVEMLIGMLQTFYCPDERIKGMDWNYIYNNPPESDKLRTTFEPFAPYFNLLGDDIRFMQDRSIRNVTDKKELVNPDTLFIDIDATQSHFRKQRIESLCLSCMTAVLYTLQVRANSGGRGHRQNLRTANAFTTVVKGETLWETCWLNVMGKSALEKYGNSKKNMPNDIFPWTFPSNVVELKSEDVSLLHCFWQMPRKIYIRDISKGHCMLCNGTDTCVTKVILSPRGIHYYGIDSKGVKQTGENWFHPLSPVKINDEKPYYKFFDHSEYGARYKHWLALTRTVPAPCVTAAKQRNKAGKLWAFGYVCSSKMALFWDDGEFSIISLTTGDRLADKDAENVVMQLIDIASKAAEDLLKYAGKAAALISKKEKEKGRKVKFIDKEQFTALFWQSSERDFYSLIDRLQDVVSGVMDKEEALSDWSKKVMIHALNVFDSFTDFDVFNSETMSIIAERRADLLRSLKKLYKTRKEAKSEENKVPKG